LVVKERAWLNRMAGKHHYMRRRVHHLASPFGWAVEFDGELYREDGSPCGFIVFASPHFTRLRGEFGYPGLVTKWQVLLLSRLWLHDDLPRNSETCVIGKALRQVQRRWLEVHPPRFLGRPYHIRKVISFADTRFHEGTIYKAANFREAGRSVTAKRHRHSKDGGFEGAELIRFVYDLERPNWDYEPVEPVQLRLF
jgi:hypothetical protein